MTKKAKHKLKRQPGRWSFKGAVPVNLPAWDMGAAGPANRERLRLEPATEINPETGRETPNPNGVVRHRRDPWTVIYASKGILNRRQFAAAEKLRMASEGMREKDPLAAIRIDRRHAQSDPLAAKVDARHYFRELWAEVPTASRPVIERVVLNDTPLWPKCNNATRERHIMRLRDGLDAIA